MPTSPSKKHVVLIDQMTAEWQSIGRASPAVAALERVATRDPVLSELVLGTGGRPARCPTPCDLLARMHRARGRAEREEAAHLVRVLLREADAEPFLQRLLVQALVPGLITVARKLQWGRGGPWLDGEEFFGELLSTTWFVLQEWAGQDRRYAVLDLLSAIRCRVRRQLFRAKDLQGRTVSLHDAADREARSETDLEQLARMLIDLRLEGMRTEEVQVLYSQHVLGYSIAELAAATGRDRRALYARRDRGRRRLYA